MTMFQYLVLAQDVVPDVAQDSMGKWINRRDRPYG
jgi:hypothetical protein